MFASFLAFFTRRVARSGKTAKPYRRPTHPQLSLELLEDRLTPSSPSISYSLVNDWGSGFQAQITITDNQSTPLNNWSLGFDFDHSITQIWNGSIASHSGNQYEVGNVGYNADIAPGQSVTIGFLGSPGNVTDQPTDFNLTYAGSGNQQSGPTVATPAAASPSPVTGVSVNLSVLGADAAGAGSLTYTWATTGSPPAGVKFSVDNNNAADNTVATFSKAGVYNFQATITDPAGLSVTSSVQVTVEQTLTSVVVSPSTAKVNTGATQQFTASADDQFGNPLATQPAFTWTASGGGTDHFIRLGHCPFALAGGVQFRQRNGRREQLGGDHHHCSADEFSQCHGNLHGHRRLGQRLQRQHRDRQPGKLGYQRLDAAIRLQRNHLEYLERDHHQPYR